jgi:uncharacterized protein YndB with AHSA1/START domain
MDHLSVAPELASDPDDDDLVFKALADPSRRALLDSLFEEDGQALGELAARLPHMTRFGVMKHLRLLEAAGLISSRKIGREKLHYLNPVPIRQMHDRWIGKYAELWVTTLTNLKSDLEGRARPRHEFRLYIRASIERVWQAITEPELTARYFDGARVDSTWHPGDRVAYVSDGELVAEGRLLRIEPPTRLVQTWSFQADADPPSRLSWELAAAGAATRLWLVNDELPRDPRSYQRVDEVWAKVLSSLKSLLETGEPLTISG